MGHRANPASKKKRARDLAEEKEDEEEGEAQVGTNKRLLEELIQQIPTYDWQAPPREDRDLTGFDRIKIPKPSEPINYKKRGEVGTVQDRKFEARGKHMLSKAAAKSADSAAPSDVCDPPRRTRSALLGLGAWAKDNAEVLGSGACGYAEALH